MSSNFQIYLGKTDDPPPVASKRWKWYPALHSMQFYISVVTMNCVIWS